MVEQFQRQQIEEVVDDKLADMVAQEEQSPDDSPEEVTEEVAEEDTTEVDALRSRVEALSNDFIAQRDAIQRLEEQATGDTLDELNGVTDDQKVTPIANIRGGERVRVGPNGEQVEMAVDDYQWYVAGTCNGTLAIQNPGVETERKRVTHVYWTAGCLWYLYDKQTVADGIITKLYKDCPQLIVCAEPCVELVDPECV